MARVVHLTSVHVPFDTRIFQKECRALAESGHEVVLLAPHDRTETVAGVRVVGSPPPSNRWARMVLGLPGAYRRARAERADVVHFHDPELLPVGLALALRGQRVIWDSHEDLPKQVLAKEWLPPRLRPAAAAAVGLVERLCVTRFAAVISAEPEAAKRFRHERLQVVQNWPRPDEITVGPTPYADREPVVAYVGAITRTRGAMEMAHAMSLVPPATGCRLVLAGWFSPPELEAEVVATAGRDRVEALGRQSRDGVKELLGRARVGLAVVHPTAQYRSNQPVKLLEYMAAGIPFVASDFPVWRELAGDEEVGIFVDPADPSAIAAAVGWLLDHPEEAAAMGKRGRAEVERNRSWPTEADKLLRLYDDVLAQ